MTQASPTGPRRGRLTRELIVEAALRLLDDEGESALTFIRLGDELGASSTAVYRHFGSKHDIITAIADHLDELSLSGYMPTDEWRTDIVELAERVWDTAIGHPAAAAAAMFTPAGGVHELRAIDCVLRALHAAGLRDGQAAAYYRAFASLFLGVSAAQAVRLSQQGGVASEWVQVYRPTDPARFPYAEAVRDELRFSDPDEIFRMHIEMYVESVANAVDRRPLG